MVASRLFLWPAARDEWVSCPPDEITWLDRAALSGNEDLSLHRAPRCAGLRFVHHRWELFSRDPTYPVYLAPQPATPPSTDTARADMAQSDSVLAESVRADRMRPHPERPDMMRADPVRPEAARADAVRPSSVLAEAVRQAARHVLPAATAGYEARPVPLDGGLWLISVSDWVLRLRLDSPAVSSADPVRRDDDEQAMTQAGRIVGHAGAEAVARVRAYFERNTTARLAMAYYYQQYILGLAAPQDVPMSTVVIALDLSGEGAISDYKKLLQGLIWSERGHARDLAGFLLANGLLTPADLAEARETAEANERAGVCEMARQRLRYRQKGRPLPPLT